MKDAPTNDIDDVFPGTAPAAPPPSRQRHVGVRLRSALIGLMSTAVDFVILAFSVSVLGVSPLVANVPALLAGVAVQFVGNKYWAFRDRDPRVARQLTLFSLVELGALGLNAGLFHAVVSAGLAGPYVARPLVSAVVYFAFSLVLWRRIFRSPQLAQRDATAS